MLKQQQQEHQSSLADHNISNEDFGLEVRKLADEFLKLSQVLEQNTLTLNHKNTGTKTEKCGSDDSIHQNPDINPRFTDTLLNR